MNNILLLMLVASISCRAMSTNVEMRVATGEMQKANYFTFVMLINMAPADLFPAGNITFLMPNDRTLSKTSMAGVVNFLLNHSIPSPLLIDSLLHFPTGSMIPTSRPGSMLRVTNDGRRQFFLNNVRVVSPNICTKSSSIRCHGIDGVLQPVSTSQPSPTPNCHLNGTMPPAPAAPLPAPSPPVPPVSDVNPFPTTAPPPLPVPAHVSHPKSSCCKIGRSRFLDSITMSLMLFLVKRWLYN